MKPFDKCINKLDEYFKSFEIINSEKEKRDKKKQVYFSIDTENIFIKYTISRKVVA
jgi:hypothetical protein